MTIRKKPIIAAAAIVIIAGVLVAVLTNNKPTSADTEVLHAAYPLYAQGIAWGDEVPLSLPPHIATNPTDQTIVGNLVMSQNTATTTDIGSQFEPFRMYYDKQLLEEGWKIAPTFQADGAGSSVWGYAKGNSVLIFSYRATFLDEFADQPLQCPCTLQFSILGGTLQ